MRLFLVALLVLCVAVGISSPVIGGQAPNNPNQPPQTQPPNPNQMPPNPNQTRLMVTLGADPQQYNGPCPVTVKFVGTIKGMPGRHVSYLFAHKVGVTTTTTPLTGPVALPATGALVVLNSLTVDAAHAGPQTNELRAFPGPVKATVTFFISCTALGTPKPPPSGGSSRVIIRSPINPGVFATTTPKPTPFRSNRLPGGSEIVLNPLRPPTGLTSTTDPAVCADHIQAGIFSGLLCAAAIKDGLLLIWDWAPYSPCTGCITSVDGYRIYRVDGGMHALVTTQSGGQDYKGKGISNPGDGFTGKCYAATAYKGATESQDSKRYCLGSVAIGTAVKTFTPSQTRIVWHDDGYRTGVTCGTLTPSVHSIPGVGPEVGYEYTGSEDTFCNYHSSKWTRGAMLFDLSSLAGKKIWKATLHLPISRTDYGGKVPLASGPWIHYSSSFTCMTQLGIGTSAWWSGSGWIDMTGLETWTPVTAPSDVDVRAQVALWVTSGDPNYGFVLRGEMEGEQHPDWQLACYTYYHAPTLTVEYFP